MSKRENQFLRPALASSMLVALCLVVPVFAGGAIFVSTGGAYSGTVGKPIQVNAGATVNEDGGEIRGYYWDWFGDGVFECASLPECQHTWHSAYSGTIVLHVWDEHNDLGAGEAPVVATGPENILMATLESHADLHLFGPRSRHTGRSPISGTLKTQVPDSRFLTLDVGGQETNAGAQAISWPLYMAGTYKVQAVGKSDGPFRLTISATQNGTPVLEKTVSGAICKGETLTVNVTGSCTDGQLQVAFDEPAFGPGVCVEPSKITLTVEAGKSYQVPLTVREAFLRTPLSSVSLTNEDIAGPMNKVAAGAIQFAPQSFNLKPGGQTTVIATIPVPEAFMGKATGRIVVRSGEGAAGYIDVTLKTPGTCSPHCNGIGPIAGLVGVPVTFDASNSYDPDGEIMQYAWDWDGDGAFDEWTVVPTITHTWDAPFTGKIRLIIFDNDNECADTYVEVTITNP